MTTLVVCLDRGDDIGRRSGQETPVVGWESVHDLVADVGLSDPENPSVNSILETLRIARELEDGGDDAVVAVVSGDRESLVRADRAVAAQIDDLVERYDPDGAVVIIDSAEDEQLVPVVESRVPVDSVDRVIVRQAQDIESTYYRLKQFLADEELRQAVLVPLGLTLLVFPLLATVFSPTIGGAAITAVIGLFLLYKGFNVDEILGGLARRTQEALYAGQVSVVTYVVAVGLTLVGLFVGALGVSGLEDTQGFVVPAMQFAFDSVPWLAMAALTASAGRLLDEIIRDEPLRASFLNLPFAVVAVGLVVRGFSAYFLQQQGVIDPMTIPAVTSGVLRIDSYALGPGERLAGYIVAAVLLSLVGVRLSMYFSGRRLGSGPDAVGERTDGGRDR